MSIPIFSYHGKTLIASWIDRVIMQLTTAEEKTGIQSQSLAQVAQLATRSLIKDNFGIRS